MEWWQWIIVGLIFLGLELFTPSGFFIFFAGVGFIVTGLAVYFGLLVSFSQELACVSVLTVALALVLRKKLLGIWTSGGGLKGDSRSVEGQLVEIVETIGAGEMGRGSFRGAEWAVQNIGLVSAIAGERYAVVARDGLTVKIEAK